jgi:hypothetical protein
VAGGLLIVTPALYLVYGRKIGRVGATGRLRPWSTKKTARKSKGRRALLFLREEPEQLPGPLRKNTRGARIRKVSKAPPRCDLAGVKKAAKQTPAKPIPVRSGIRKR